MARRQEGVVTRAQALAEGMTDKQIRWRLERGDWRRLHHGVYLTHTGRITWRTRAWAALLRCGPDSVLVLESAAHVWRLRPEPKVITVGVPRSRHPEAVRGVRCVRRSRLNHGLVDGLPVTRVAQTVIDLADQPRTRLDDAVALAATACQRGLVREPALVAELTSRRAHRFRRELLLACGEIGDGAESLPEVWFVTRVQRPHGLPVFVRQRRVGRTRIDLANEEYRVNFEADGRLWHGGSRFHTDRRRDRRAAGRGWINLRGTYLELDQIPCEVAIEVAAVLRQRGWPGPLLPCSPSCPVADQEARRRLG